jgi:hypothetical protein
VAAAMACLQILQQQKQPAPCNCAGDWVLHATVSCWCRHFSSMQHGAAADGSCALGTVVVLGMQGALGRLHRKATDAAAQSRGLVVEGSAASRQYDELS